MAAQPDRFQVLMSNLRAGYPEAAQELVAEYGDVLRRAVRRVLQHKHGRIGLSESDVIDYMQSVWRSFFEAIRALEVLEQIDCDECLSAYLTEMAKNKVLLAARRERTQRRGEGRPPLSIDDPAQRLQAEQIADGRPDPSEAMIAAEARERVLSGESDEVRRILELSCEGFTHVEIGEIVGKSRFFVSRTLKRLGRKLPGYSLGAGRE
jgi:RNA polymerase sigma factor (sigma-70 family)